ncbi:MAG: helix-hairpin-helix domain-containing protein [Planctomycetota bacterium]|nr:helix-hairpin-helix domain-containing protein [Planctomycetota bacterium]
MSSRRLLDFLIILFAFLIILGVLIRTEDNRGDISVVPLCHEKPKLLVDINSASTELLSLLPGIGEKTAEKIVEYRRKKGRIESLSELERIEGLGKKRLERIAPYVR